MNTPLIVQSDGSILLDVHDPGADEARSAIAGFTELIKSPEHMHTYRITPLSVWNGASAGLQLAEIEQSLSGYSRFPVPGNILFQLRDLYSRYGVITMHATDEEGILELQVHNPDVLAELQENRELNKLTEQTASGFRLHLYQRGTVKQTLIHIGYPVQDLAPLAEGEDYPFALRKTTTSGRPFAPREYQVAAVESFVGDGRPGTGFGTVVLACGAGKTIVGMQAMYRLQTSTLILTTNIAAVHQWIRELVDKTDIPREDIGEYTGERKEIKPITVATYQILVWRPDVESDFPHFSLFSSRRWGLIIYDEVHLLPAPMFRVTAEIQAVRRIGLTATLVREDGREGDVFSLVGPKRYDVPWKELEERGWIAAAECHEIRLPLPAELKIPYATADKRAKFRIASENPLKIEATRQLIAKHPQDAILVIGQYVAQLKKLAAELNAPLITGSTPNQQREEIYQQFRDGEQRIIVVSKVANFAIDLPDASMAIQVSGTFGSRQEEAQRLGRILRPKDRNVLFFSLVSRFTTEEQFSANRQKFLTEQGYKYHIELYDPEV
ncbi:DNA repair helicase XPB [Spirochaeta africana]|nr:DNA repair helicase XPB [Spirochaeta africana]